MNTINRLNELIKTRRTIHRFSNQPIPQKYIDEALSLITYAPNHYLTYPYRFYKIGDKCKSIFLERAYQSFKERDLTTAKRRIERWESIPGWLLITQKISTDEQIMREDFATISIALYLIMLSLHRHNIGSKWSTASLFFEESAWYDLCNIDVEEEVIRGVLWYGYPHNAPKEYLQPDATDFITEID